MNYWKAKLDELRHKYPTISDAIIKDILLAGVEANAIWQDGERIVGALRKKFSDVQREIEAA
jgi:uncharacterized protein with ATP-grasp and redox domains